MTITPALWAIRSNGLILIEAPSLADHRGLLSVATTLVTNKAETSRRFYTTPHPYDCGIARHTRTLYVCLLHHASETLLHRHRQATPEAAVFCWRDDPAGQTLLASVEKKHRQGKALPSLAHHVARAV